VSSYFQSNRKRSKKWTPKETALVLPAPPVPVLPEGRFGWDREMRINRLEVVLIAVASPPWEAGERKGRQGNHPAPRTSGPPGARHGRQAARSFALVDGKARKVCVESRRVRRTTQRLFIPAPTPSIQAAPNHRVGDPRHLRPQQQERRRGRQGLVLTSSRGMTCKPRQRPRTIPNRRPAPSPSGLCGVFPFRRSANLLIL